MRAAPAATVPDPGSPTPASAGDPAHYDGADLEAMAHAPRYHAWILERLAPWIRGDVADVGTGIGNFARLLPALPIRSLTLFEPCAALHARLPSSLQVPGVTRRAESLRDAHPRSAFDTVCYVNVLEHVPDDERELACARNALRPGGHICVFVPALSWLDSAHDRDVGHQRRYRKQDLHDKLARTGFAVARLQGFDAPGVLAWAIGMKLLRLRLRPSTAALYDRAVVPWARLLERIAAPPLGKNLVAVGRR